MKNGPIKKVKNFVSNHKTAIAFWSGAVVAGAALYKLQNTAIREANGFIAEKGLTAEFITSLEG